jgi:tetratricopeptide (TPR) repeat protein
MSSTSPSGSSIELVHEGWDHLRSWRPLAAWGSWQRALRRDPGSTAAGQALATLESAADLPMAARVVYRFRRPADPARCAVWDDRLGSSGDAGEQELEAMADAFGRLAAEGPPDPAAWYNRALCLAWLGANREAVGCLDRVAGLEAEPAFDRAVEAWTLAEVLRQGGGAESLSDELRFTCTVAWEPGDTAWLLEMFPEIQRVPTPHVPGALHDPAPDNAVFEWLDRCVTGLVEEDRPARAGDLPTVLASVYLNPPERSLRLSSPRVETLGRVEEILLPRLEDGRRSIRREASPLSLPFLDADVWTVRIPPGVEPVRADQLLREWIEHYYEDEWVHRARQGLDGLSPLMAAQKARRGDPVLRAKLTAVVRFREQLGSRPSALRLYQGYPFDRLRRRLELELANPASVDSEDLTCAGPDELDRLDSAALDDHRLAEAVASAAGLRDDARTGRLAAELIRRRPRECVSIDLAAAVAPLVRQAMSASDFDAALRWIEQARPMGDAKTAATLDVWRAEVLARAGRPDAALRAYRDLIRPDGAGALLALDGAETLIDNSHLDQARPLLDTARDLARSTGRRWIERRAEELLDRL